MTRSANWQLLLIGALDGVLVPPAIVFAVLRLDDGAAVVAFNLMVLSAFLCLTSAYVYFTRVAPLARAVGWGLLSGCVLTALYVQANVN